MGLKGAPTITVGPLSLCPDIRVGLSLELPTSREVFLLV